MAEPRTYCIEGNTMQLKLGKHTVSTLRRLSLKESIRRQAPVSMTDLIKEALLNTFPDLFKEE